MSFRLYDDVSSTSNLGSSVIEFNIMYIIQVCGTMYIILVGGKKLARSQGAHKF